MTVHPAVLGVALFGGLTSVLGPARSTAGSVVTIEVFDFDFGNASTGQHVDPTIAVGDTVRWQFVTGLHSTVSVQGIAEAWDSGTVLPGASFDHTFTNPGTFAYYCDEHGMDAGGGAATGQSGMVTVLPVPEPAMILLAGVAGGVLLGRAGRPSFLVRRCRSVGPQWEGAGSNVTPARRSSPPGSRIS